VKIKAGNVTLVNEGTDGLLRRFDVEEQRLLEVAEYVRADYIEVLDRKNRRSALSFEVIRLFESFDQAGAFLIDHLLDVPAKCHVALTFYGADGAFKTRYLLNAGVQRVGNGIVVGVSTIHAYQIIGGQFTITPPTS
jgi:hypothetical protein